ncbi:hypothetical protein Hypma_008338 [Hypsizygus marmoreus]|uniref:Uncharacterized protein n=1 Tax=Hypsizygus marmoreus TaxID=39966 RepID=A0A369JRT4_HYPMA|nr:hypothetical protein Hypma_008338 [Hypsizygus marmoreus]
MPRINAPPESLPFPHARLIRVFPVTLKPLYKYFLAVPHKNKVGAERIIAHCADWEWNFMTTASMGRVLWAG